MTEQINTSSEMMNLDLQIHDAIATNVGQIQRITDPYGIDRDQLTLYPDPTNPKDTVTLSAVGGKGEPNSLQGGTPIAIHVAGHRKDPANGSFRYYPGEKPWMHSMDQHPQIKSAHTVLLPTEEVATRIADKLQAGSPERPAVQGRTARVLGRLGLRRAERQTK